LTITLKVSDLEEITKIDNIRNILKLDITPQDWMGSSFTSWYKDLGMFPNQSLWIITDSKLMIYKVTKNNFELYKQFEFDTDNILQGIEDIRIQEFVGMVMVKYDKTLTIIDFYHDEVYRIEYENIYKYNGNIMESGKGWTVLYDRGIHDFYLPEVDISNNFNIDAFEMVYYNMRYYFVLHVTDLDEGDQYQVIVYYPDFERYDEPRIDFQRCVLVKSYNSDVWLFNEDTYNLYYYDITNVNFFIFYTLPIDMHDGITDFIFNSYNRYHEKSVFPFILYQFSNNPSNYKVLIGVSSIENINNTGFFVKYIDKNTSSGVNTIGIDVLDETLFLEFKNEKFYIYDYNTLEMLYEYNNTLDIKYLKGFVFDDGWYYSLFLIDEDNRIYRIDVQKFVNNIYGYISYNPDLCKVYGRLIYPNLVSVYNKVIEFTLAEVPEVYQGNFLTNQTIYIVTDENGEFSVDLPIGSCVYVRCKEIGLDKKIRIPNRTMISLTELI